VGRLNIEALPRPAPAYQITGLPVPKGKKMVFESRPFAICENTKRRNALSANAEAAPHLYANRQARRLAWKLGRPVASMRRTPASSLYMGHVRFRLIGAVWRLIDQGPWDCREVVFFTVRPDEWEFSPEELPAARAERLIAQLKTRLNRAGASHADGFLIAFLHGEYEPTSGRYVLHAHGFAVGGMVDVLESLRGTRKHPGWLRDGRLNRSRKPITNLPYVLGYAFKSFWPCKRIGPVGDEAVVARNRHGQRIPEPFHSQYLVWLDQHSVSDLCLLMKLRVTRDGLLPTSL